MISMVGWTIRKNQWNWRPWTFFAVSSFASATMVGVGRVVDYGPAGTAGYLWYAFDYLILLLITMTLLRPPEGQEDFGLWQSIERSAYLRRRPRPLRPQGHRVDCPAAARSAGDLPHFAATAP